MYKIIGAVMIFSLVLQSCSTVESETDYPGAVAADNVPTYKLYLSMHPESEHREWIEQRIAQLEKKEARIKEAKLEQQQRKNDIQLQKVRSYKKQIGILTDKDFLMKDKWTLAKSDGVLGIVGVFKNDSSSEILIGMFPNKSGNFTVNDKQMEWIKNGEIAANDAVMQGLKEQREYSYQLPQEDYNLMCVLTFSPKEGKEARVLSGLLCNEDKT